MSRTSDVALIYEKSKTGMLLGLGYLAAKDPIRAIRIGVRVGAHLTKQVIVDAGAYSKIIKEEILVPEAKEAREWYAANRIPKGTIVTINPLIPFFLFGGAILNAITTVFKEENEDIVNYTMHEDNLF